MRYKKGDIVIAKTIYDSQAVVATVSHVDEDYSRVYLKDPQPPDIILWKYYFENELSDAPTPIDIFKEILSKNNG